MVRTRSSAIDDDQRNSLSGGRTHATRSRSRNKVQELDSDESSYSRPILKRKCREYLPSLVPDKHSLPKYSATGNAPTVSDGPVTRHSIRKKFLESVENRRERNREMEKGFASTSASSHSCNTHSFLNGDVSKELQQGVRRSTRQRRFIYDNLNQAWLLTPGIPDFSKLESMFSSTKAGDSNDESRNNKRRDIHSHELRELGMTTTDIQEFEDMYSRVKRKRRKTVNKFYTHNSQDMECMADTEETDQNDTSAVEGSDTDAGASEAIADESHESQAEHSKQHQKYHLRPKKPVTDRFQCPVEPVRPRKPASTTVFDSALHPCHTKEHRPFIPPPHRRRLYKRRRHATHNSSSTGSSSEDDERRFERRKARSMARARNRCLPVNVTEVDLTKGVLRDRSRIGASLADIDPMNIDKTVMFSCVGGLDHHIQALKETILFPLMYPEFFQRFKIAPPSGVLFYGPPGTGKTLVARALANECSQKDRHVSFFMRKGADCLSKWVGESERQLRLLFDQAYCMRPSIIFFDEIDGLAPVRSTRQDQIHSSIVSTLLALMDGLDNRGEIVVIGATNRIDAIDPSLRRPGRFDREFRFSLPSHSARRSILKIHTKEWQPTLSDQFIDELAGECTGYCGADLKGLCTEAALIALWRRYPQIYKSRRKLQIDVNSIQVDKSDFLIAMKKIIPAAQRSVSSVARPLSAMVEPLMHNTLCKVFQIILKIIPSVAAKSPFLKHLGCKIDGDDGVIDDKYDNIPNNQLSHLLLDEEVAQDRACASHNQEKSFRRWDFYDTIPSYRPRLLLVGESGQGQSTHLAPALLHCLEHIPVYKLDVPSLFGVACRLPEEACAQVFHEAARNLPSILYLPHIDQWWNSLSETVKTTFLSLLQDLEPSVPILLLATGDCPSRELPEQIQQLFNVHRNQVFEVPKPTLEEIRAFFNQIVDEILRRPKQQRKVAEEEDLPAAPSPEPRKLTDMELQRLRLHEEGTLRELRLFLRDLVTKLSRDRRFSIFTKPVNPLEVPDYQAVIKTPMDLETMMTKVDLHQYETVAQFLGDIDLICQNALEYNPDRDPSDKLIRHRACALKDTAHALVDARLDEAFEKLCTEICQARKQRGESPSKFVPKSYQALPQNGQATSNTTSTGDLSNNLSLNQTYPTRYSRRLRGIEVTPPSSDADNAKRNEQNGPVNIAKIPAMHYVLVRRKKSPWFGCGRRLKIRRSVLEHGFDAPEAEVPRTSLASPVCDLDSDGANGDDENSTSNVHGNLQPRETERQILDLTLNDHQEPSVEEGSHSRTNSNGADSTSPTLTATSDNNTENSALTSRLSTIDIVDKDSEGQIRSSEQCHLVSSKFVGVRQRSRSLDESLSHGNSTAANSNHLSQVLKSMRRSLSPEITLSTMRFNCKKEITPSVLKNDELSKSSYPLEKNSLHMISVDQQSRTPHEVQEGNGSMEEANPPENCSDDCVPVETEVLLPQDNQETDVETEESPVPVQNSIMIDHVHLNSLLEDLIQKTSGYTVEVLVWLKCSLHACIYKHRQEWDKSSLLMDLQAEVDKFFQLPSH